MDFKKVIIRCQEVYGILLECPWYGYSKRLIKWI